METIILIITILTAIAAWLVVPEVRKRLRLGQTSSPDTIFKERKLELAPSDAANNPGSALEFFLNREPLTYLPRFKININSSTKLELGVHNRSKEAIPFDSFRLSIISLSISLRNAKSIDLPTREKQYIIDLKTESNYEELFPGAWESVMLDVRVIARINKELQQAEITFARHFYDEEHKLRIDTKQGFTEYEFSLFGEFTQPN